MRTQTFRRKLEKGFSIVCQITRDNANESDPNISRVRAVIFNGADEACGFLDGQVVHFMDMLDAEKDPFWEMGNFGHVLGDLYAALLGPEKALEEIKDGIDGDLFHLMRVWIEPEYRGAQLGLTAMACLMVLFERSCEYVAMKPFPLQWENRVAGNEAQFRADRAKLCEYYEPLGFIMPPGGQEFCYRALGQERILGFGREGWKKTRNLILPPAPEQLRV